MVLRFCHIPLLLQLLFFVCATPAFSTAPDAEYVSYWDREAEYALLTIKSDRWYVVTCPEAVPQIRHTGPETVEQYQFPINKYNPLGPGPVQKPGGRRPTGEYWLASGGGAESLHFSSGKLRYSISWDTKKTSMNAHAVRGDRTQGHHFAWGHVERLDDGSLSGTLEISKRLEHRIDGTECNSYEHITLEIEIEFHSAPDAA